MSFPTNKQLEHYSQAAAKKLEKKKIVGYELKERNAPGSQQWNVALDE